MHCRYGLSKSQSKKRNIGCCYLMVMLDGNGYVKNVSLFSEKSPTICGSEIKHVLTLMVTKGSSYEKAERAMQHAIRINARYRWAQSWVSNEKEFYFRKPELWKKARENQLHARDCGLESRFLEAVREEVS